MVLSGAHLIDPRADIEGTFDLVVRDGEIAELCTPGAVAPTSDTELVDARGLTVLPGFVDPHVHLRTPGREDEEDLESGTRAAAAGGFCAVLAMPNTDPVTDNAAVLCSLQERASEQANVPVGFFCSITREMAGTDLSEMAELALEGAAGFTDDGVPVREARVMRRALQYQRLSGAVLALHEEDPSLSGKGVMHEGAVSTQLGLAGIPSVSESTMIDRDAELARYEDGRIHVLHLSAAESVEAVAHAKQRGTRVTAEVTPHHLTLTDDRVRSLDSNLKMNPPLRSESDRQALIDGLRSGVIDCVATDHAPHSREEKEMPFEQAPMGVTGLETAFAALYTDLVAPGVISLELLLERMTSAGKLFGLAAPTLAQGAPANLCLIDLESSWTVGESGYESRSSNSCFAGRSLQGKVLMTLASGSVAFRERSFSIRLASATEGGR
ncbi:MAG: dihydroorotase [Solirubrobacterales bacterium]